MALVKEHCGLSEGAYLMVLSFCVIRLLFMQCCREVAAKYPDIIYEEVIIDNCCMMVSFNYLLLESCMGYYLFHALPSTSQFCDGLWACSW